MVNFLTFVFALWDRDLSREVVGDDGVTETFFNLALVLIGSSSSLEETFLLGLPFFTWDSLLDETVVVGLLWGGLLLSGLPFFFLYIYLPIKLLSEEAL